MEASTQQATPLGAAFIQEMDLERIAREQRLLTSLHEVKAAFTEAKESLVASMNRVGAVGDGHLYLASFPPEFQGLAKTTMDLTDELVLSLNRVLDYFETTYSV